MDAAGLRAMQAPHKESYKQDPGAALITLKATGEIDDAKIACKVETGRALAVAGLHPATGGSGAELCSGDMLLEALVACAGVTLKAVATALEIPLRRGVVKAEGDLDFRGTLGVAKDAPVGFRAIRLAFAIDSDAHAPGQLDWQPYGCARAADCGLTPSQIVNTWTVEELLAWTGRHD